MIPAAPTARELDSSERAAPTLIAGRARGRLRDRLAAEPRPRRAPAAREAVPRRGVRAVEQLVVRRPPHVPATASCSRRSRRCSHRSSRPALARDRHGGAVRAARPPTTSARTRGSARVWFGAATATNLFTGRLAFAFGLLPAMATALALAARRTVAARTLLAVLDRAGEPGRGAVRRARAAAHTRSARYVERAAGPRGVCRDVGARSSRRSLPVAAARRSRSRRAAASRSRSRRCGRSP